MCMPILTLLMPILTLLIKRRRFQDDVRIFSCDAGGDVTDASSVSCPSCSISLLLLKGFRSLQNLQLIILNIFTLIN